MCACGLIRRTLTLGMGMSSRLSTVNWPTKDSYVNGLLEANDQWYTQDSNQFYVNDTIIRLTYSERWTPFTKTALSPRLLETKLAEWILLE